MRYTEMRLRKNKTLKLAFGLVAALALTVVDGCASHKQGRYDSVVREADSDILSSGSHPYGGGEDILLQRETLDMNSAVQAALDNNPSLASIREKVREAVEKYPLTVTLDDPTMGIGFYPLSVESDRTDFAYRIDFRQKIPYPGKLSFKGDLAIAEAQVVFNEFGSARLELVRMVKTAYLEFLYIHRAVDSNEENKKLLRQFRSIAVSRYAAGMGNLQDSIQADVRLARAEHRDIVLERRLGIVQARLNTLMGRAAGLWLPRPVNSFMVTALPDRKRLIARALSSAPAIKAADARIEMATASLRLAESQSYPDFTITGSYNTAWMTDELQPFIGVGVNIPIRFDRLKAEKKIAMAKRRRANLERKAVENRIRFQVEEAWRRLAESRHAEKLFRQTLLPEAVLSLNSAKAGYGDGKNDFLTLVSAERALVDDRLRYERILVDIRIRRVELSRIIGEKP